MTGSRSAARRSSPSPGSFLVREVLGESVILVRGRDDEIRAFYNVCRHRGTAVEERDCGKAVRFQCPYHAWIYDIDGNLMRAKHTEDLEDFSLDTYGLAPIRTETWQGFVFLCFADESVTAGLEQYMGDWYEHHASFGRDMAKLTRAARMTYDVGANWKIVAENYSECYHCPPVHPLLNKLTPYDLGEDFLAQGPWKGGWMPFAEGCETMSMSGKRDGRPLLYARDETEAQADLLLHPVAQPDRLGPPGLRADAPGVARRPQPEHRQLRPLRRGRQARARSTSAARRSSGTSPTARTTTWSRPSSRAPDRAHGSPAATRTRRRRSTRSTSWSRTAT